MDPREDPALEISKLQTILERLVSKRLPMNDMVAAMTAVVAMPDNWDHVASLILSTTEIDDLYIPHIVPIIQEEYKRRQAKGQVPKKANIARVKIPNAPKRQEWKGNQQQQVNQQAGPSTQQSPYLNRNFKKFQPKYNNNQQNAGNNYYQNSQKAPEKGPNWDRNQRNRSNKKLAKQLLIERVDKLENQTKKSDKGKVKMVNLATYETFGKPKLLQRIDQIKEEDLLIKRMENLDSFKARGFSIDDNVEKSLEPLARIEEITEDTEMISLGSDDEDREAQYYEADWNQYVTEISKILANEDTVMTIVTKLTDSFNNSISKLLESASSHSTNSEINKFYLYNCVKASANLKKCFNIDKSTDIWIVDSGASHHITNKKSDFTEYIPYAIPEVVQTANKEDNTVILGEGTIFFDTKTDKGQTHQIRLDQVCYIPNGSNRLLSRGQLCLSGLIERADAKSTTFSLPTGHIYIEGFPRYNKDTLHWVQSQIAHPNVPMAEPSVFLVNYDTWHLRMGHPSKNVLKHVEGNTNGFTNKLKIPSTNSICPGCAQGKMHNKAFPMSEKRASKPLELIHADLVELPIQSYHKYKYACMILEDYSSFASCTLLRSKSETLTAVKNFIELMENQLETKIKQFRSDRGGEFKSKEFDIMLKSKGIIRQTSAPHIHQQNGCAERINNTILEKSEALRTHSGCPQSWWEFSFETAIHVYNRTPIRRTKWTTPFENLFNKKPDVHYFKAFSCLAWVYIPKELRKNKLDPRSEKMTFVGYDIGSKVYKFMQKDNAVFTATHALFDENTYPRLKNENEFGKNKLLGSPTGITKDQEDIIIPTNPTKPIDHDHNPDHNNSSDDTSDDEKQKSESEEEEES